MVRKLVKIHYKIRLLYLLYVTCVICIMLARCIRGLIKIRVSPDYGLKRYVKWQASQKQINKAE